MDDTRSTRSQATTRFVITSSFEKLIYNLKHAIPRDVDLFIVQGPSRSVFDFCSLAEETSVVLTETLRKRSVTVVRWQDFLKKQSEIMMNEESAVCIVGYPALQPLLKRFSGSACHLWYVVPQLSILDALAGEYAFQFVAMDIPSVHDDWNILHMLRDKYTMTEDPEFFEKTIRDHVNHTKGLFKVFAHV